MDVILPLDFSQSRRWQFFFQPAKIESKHPPKGPSTKTRSKRFQSSDFLQIQFSISADPDFGIATDLQNWYSFYVYQTELYFRYASIWHEIISWYLRISQYLRNMITRLFCTNMKIKTKTIYWSSFVNHGQIVHESLYRDLYSRVANVVADHDDLSTQWRPI